MVYGLFQSYGQYVSCEFHHDRIRIVQRIDNETIVLAQKLHGFGLPRRGFAVALQVRDGAIECVPQDTVFARAGYVDPQLRQGGVRFMIWDTELNTGMVMIEYVQVERV